MKRQLLFLAALVLAMISCQKNDFNPPQLTIDFLKATTTTAEFSITAVDAQKMSYKITLVSEPAPAPGEVISNGTPLELGAEKIVLADLAPNKEYVIYLAAQNEDKMTICNASFSTNYKLNLAATFVKQHYYGDFFNTGDGAYYLSFSDMEQDNQLLPKVIDQEVIRVLCISNLSDDSNNAKLPAGKYVESEEVKAGTFYISEAHYTKCVTLKKNGLIEKGIDLLLKQGYVDVQESNGIYTIVIEATLSDKEASKIRVEYSGELKFRNMDPKSYALMTEDVVMKPEAISGRYTVYVPKNDKDPQYGNYSIVLHNVLLDKDGFIIGAGELLNCEFLTQPSKPMTLSDLAGTYKVKLPENGTVFQPRDMIGGMMYDMYGMFIPGGTSYTLYDEYALPVHYGLVNGGTVNISVEGNNITFDMVLETTSKAKVTVKYTSSSEGITDFTTNKAPASFVMPKSIGLSKSFGHPTLQFEKIE